MSFRKKIEEAIEQAKSERTEWDAVVEAFNQRFHSSFLMAMVKGMLLEIPC